MRVLLIISSIMMIFGTVSCTSGDREPTEDEMADAVKANFDRINANLLALAKQCERREYRHDRALAMQCLALCTTGGGKCSAAFTLTRFGKLGCAKANGQPGYVCDYVIGFASNSPFARGAINKMTGGGNSGQGRFLRRDNEWIYLPITQR